MALYAFYTNSSNTPELYISTSCQPLRARSSNGCTHKTEGQCLHLACLRVKKLIPRPYITRTCSYNNKKGASTPETKDALNRAAPPRNTTTLACTPIQTRDVFHSGCVPLPALSRRSSQDSRLRIHAIHTKKKKKWFNFTNSSYIRNETYETVVAEDSTMIDQSSSRWGGAVDDKINVTRYHHKSQKNRNRSACGAYD